MTFSNRNMFLSKTYIFLNFLAYVNIFYIKNFLKKQEPNFENNGMHHNHVKMLKLLIFEKLFVIS